MKIPDPPDQMCPRKPKGDIRLLWDGLVYKVNSVQTIPAEGEVPSRLRLMLPEEGNGPSILDLNMPPHAGRNEIVSKIMRQAEKGDRHHVLLVSFENVQGGVTRIDSGIMSAERFEKIRNNYVSMTRRRRAAMYNRRIASW